MAEIAIIRCEKNLEKCPLKSCLKSLVNKKEAFSQYSHASPAGIFVCRCPGDNVVELARKLKSKGAEVIHFTTCTFATKTLNGWCAEEGGFCERIDDIMKSVHKKADISCVKGTAHLPPGYVPVVLG
ncbi:MAG: CGGC domain-containing protein [bacterium]